MFDPHRSWFAFRQGIVCCCNVQRNCRGCRVRISSVLLRRAHGPTRQFIKAYGAAAPARRWARAVPERLDCSSTSAPVRIDAAAFCVQASIADDCGHGIGLPQRAASAEKPLLMQSCANILETTMRRKGRTLSTAIYSLQGKAYLVRHGCA